MRSMGEFDEFLANKFKEDWGVEMPGRLRLMRRLDYPGHDGVETIKFAAVSTLWK